MVHTESIRKIKLFQGFFHKFTINVNVETVFERNSIQIAQCYYPTICPHINLSVRFETRIHLRFAANTLTDWVRDGENDAFRGIFRGTKTVLKFNSSFGDKLIPSLSRCDCRPSQPSERWGCGGKKANRSILHRRCPERPSWHPDDAGSMTALLLLLLLLLGTLSKEGCCFVCPRFLPVQIIQIEGAAFEGNVVVVVEGFANRSTQSARGLAKQGRWLKPKFIQFWGPMICEWVRTAAAPCCR